MQLSSCTYTIREFFLDHRFLFWRGFFYISHCPSTSGRWVDKHTELTAELLKLGGSETELELFYLDLIKQPSLLAGHSKMNPLSSSLFLELQNIKKLWKLAESFASVSEWRNN
ncbi:uncharacterized protein ACIBXB_020318 isoform 2-T3 [Morphnus guianensis]